MCWIGRCVPSAKCFSLGVMYAAVKQLPLGPRHKPPIHQRLDISRACRGIIEIEGRDLGKVAIGELIEASCLDDSNRDLSIFCQTVGQGEACSAASYDLELLLAGATACGSQHCFGE